MSGEDDGERLRALAEFSHSLVTPAGLDWLVAQLRAEHGSSNRDLAARAFREAAGELVRYQDRLDATRDEMALLGTPPPDDVHLRFFSETRDFYRSFYDSMEHLMKVLDAHRSAFGGSGPPRRGVERLLAWIASLGPIDAGLVSELQAARSFRTALTHSAELPSWDWMTFEIDRGGEPMHLVRLFGEGPTPANGYPCEPSADFPGTWHLLPPRDDAVVRIFAIVSWMLFSLIAGHEGARHLHVDGSAPWVQDTVTSPPRDLSSG